MGTATFVKGLSDMRGHASLYKLDPPLVVTDCDWNAEEADREVLETHEYVVVSAVVVPFNGPETYIFPANAEGHITSWGELEGSFRGGLDHAEALKGAGYKIVRALQGANPGQRRLTTGE